MDDGTRVIDGLLEERKLASYLDMLQDFMTRRVLSLVERQQVAGRMIRGVMTLPPGASCFLSNMPGQQATVEAVSWSMIGVLYHIVQSR